MKFENKLTHSNASNNAITNVPSEIGGLRSLERLDLSNNSIRRLPPEIRQCDKLKELCLRGNQWLCPQARICERGKDAVFRELEQLESAHGDALKSTLVDVRNVHVNESWKCTVLVSDSNGVPRVCGGDKVSAALVELYEDGTIATLAAKYGLSDLVVPVEDK